MGSKENGRDVKYLKSRQAVEGGNESIHSLRSSDKKRTERDKKLKWDYIDSKVAMFADKVLLEH